MILSDRFVRMSNYGLVVASFFIFLLIAVSFFPRVEHFIVAYWLEGNKLERALRLNDSLSASVKNLNAGFSQQKPCESGRKLFMKTSAPETIPKPLLRDDETVKGLRLVAIIRDGDAKVAIEDKKDAQTYLVAVNEYCGSLKVAEIGDNKVVLEKDGMFYSLFM